jgi:hypothetical protein
MTRKKGTPLSEGKLISDAISDDTRVPRSKALVFISHDSRDADLAEAFGNLLTDVSGGILKHFRSSDRKGTAGIEFGEEWFKAIMLNLGDATDVVALLTQHSIDRPWILYEAGVAKGTMATTVFGVAIGVPLEQASTGPFAQFQNCGDDEDSLTKLVLQLIRRNPDAAPREEAVRRHVAAFRESVAGVLKSRGAAAHTGKGVKVDEGTVAKLFEEVKVMFRALPDSLEEKMLWSMRRGMARRNREMHPRMVEELLFNPMFSERVTSPSLGWLIFISVFRDDLPWFYELGLEFYRALQGKSRDQITMAAKQLRQCVDVCMNSPFSEMFIGPEEKRSMHMLRRFPEMLDHFLMRTETLGEPPLRRLKRRDKAEE